MSIALSCAYCLFPTNFSRIVKPGSMYTYEDMERDLLALAAKYPHSLHLEVYGKSREGRKLYAAIAGNKAAPHAALIQGGIHAREYITTPLVMMQLERLLHCGVPKDMVFYMLPMTNPDGVRISQTGKSTAAQDAMYRADVAGGYTSVDKETYLREWKANSVGVDLNRNFDAMWERVHNHPMPSSANYRGPYPESEPETRALVAITEQRPFDATISYHSAGEEIYYEFGTDRAVNDASRALAGVVGRLTGYELVPDSGTSFGGYKDWAMLKKKIPSLTIEVGEGQSPLPSEELRDIWRQNKDVPYAVAHYIKKRKGVWY